MSILLFALSKILYALKVFCRGKKMALRSLLLQPLFKKCDKSVRFAKLGRIASPHCISIGKKTYIGSHSYITVWPEYKTQDEEPEIIIGEKCKIGAYNHISSTNRIVIGDGFLSGKWVTILDNNHGDSSIEQLKMSPSDRPMTSKGSVIIGKNVWVGDKSTILPGVTIGEGTVIAANSVVTKSIPPYSIVAGIPARVVKHYNIEKIADCEKHCS